MAKHDLANLESVIEAAFDAEAVKRDRSPAQVQEFRLGVGGDGAEGLLFGSDDLTALVLATVRADAMRKARMVAMRAVVDAGLGGLVGSAPLVPAGP